MKRFLILLNIICIPVFSQQERNLNRSIDPARLEEVSGYLQNTKLDLERGVAYSKTLPVSQKESYLRSLLEQSLVHSKGKNEYLMRDTLKRTQAVYSSLSTSMGNDPKRDTTALLILNQGIEKAISLYEADENIIRNSDYLVSKLKPVEFAIIGYQWLNYVTEIYYSLPSNKSRLLIVSDALKIFYNDILDDSTYNRLLAPVAKNIMLFEMNLRSVPESNNIEKLTKARSIRAFIINELMLIENLVNSITLSSDSTRQLQSLYESQVDTKLILFNNSDSCNKNDETQLEISNASEIEPWIKLKSYPQAVKSILYMQSSKSFCFQMYVKNLGTLKHTVESLLYLGKNFFNNQPKLTLYKDDSCSNDATLLSFTKTDIIPPNLCRSEGMLTVYSVKVKDDCIDIYNRNFTSFCNGDLETYFELFLKESQY